MGRIHFITTFFESPMHSRLFEINRVNTRTTLEGKLCLSSSWRKSNFWTTYIFLFYVFDALTLYKSFQFFIANFCGRKTFIGTGKTAPLARKLLHTNTRANKQWKIPTNNDIFSSQTDAYNVDDECAFGKITHANIRQSGNRIRVVTINGRT